jgi:hypothetical protein
MVEGRAGGGGGGFEFNTYLFTAGPTQIYTSQPFSLHCNKKFIHAAGDHHGSRQNIRPYRTVTKLAEKQGDVYFYSVTIRAEKRGAVCFYSVTNCAEKQGAVCF